MTYPHPMDDTTGFEATDEEMGLGVTRLAMTDTATGRTEPIVNRILPSVSTAKLLQASGSFDFKFEELGLEIQDGYEAGQYDGIAEVTYWHGAGELEWFVNDIILDCHKWDAVNNTWRVQHCTLDPESKLYRDIWSVLTEGRFHDVIEARVMQDIEA